MPILENGKNVFFRYLKSDRIIGWILILVCWIWFWPMVNKGAIMGDDVVLISRFYQLEWDNFIDTVVFGYQGDMKYRPVFNVIQYFTTTLFGLNYALYFAFNLLIQSLIVAFLYYLLQFITKSKWISCVFTVLYIFNFYNYYAVTQLFGTMEAMCVLFLLVSIYFALQYYQNHSLIPLLISLFFSLLNIFTHERFIVLLPVYIILILLTQTQKKRVPQYLVLVTLPFAFNYVIKTAFLGLPFFQGTGGTSISVNLETILKFFTKGLLNIFGVNIGPEYLNGYTFFAYTDFEQIITILSVVIAFLFLLVYLTRFCVKEQKKDKKYKELKYLLLAICGIGATLLSGCITIRLEMRWIIAPLVIYFCYFSYIASKFKYSIWCKIGISIVAVICVFNSVQFRENMDGLYFMRAMKIAQSAQEQIINQYGEQLKNYTVICMGNNEMEWALGNEDANIFSLMLGESVNYQFVETEEELLEKKAQQQGMPIKVFELQDDLTVQEKTEYSYKYTTDLGDQELHNVLPKTKVDTPSGEGLIFEEDGGLILLSGFTDTIKNITIFPETILSFSATMDLEATDGATLQVSYVQNGVEIQLASIPLVYGVTETRKLELHNHETITSDIVFRVVSPSGDDRSDWVNIKDVILLSNG